MSMAYKLLRRAIGDFASLQNQFWRNASVITLKPAIHYHFKTGQRIGLRRDCFTLRRGAFARRDLSGCSYGRVSSLPDAC
jgi:hypothetical protein